MPAKINDGIRVIMTSGEITAKVEFPVEDFVKAKECYDAAKRAITEITEKPPLVAAAEKAEKENDGKRKGNT